MATGFHGFHVIVGTIFLAVCLWRGKLGHFTKDHHFGFEAAAWYWHFVDVVWLFLFAAILYLGEVNLQLLKNKFLFSVFVWFIILVLFSLGFWLNL